jgi:hypothetical protein
MKIFEYVKIVEIATYQMIGLVEDERWFSTLAFKKNKIKKYIY